MAEKISVIIVSQNDRLRELLEMFLSEYKAEFNVIGGVNLSSDFNYLIDKNDKAVFFIESTDENTDFIKSISDKFSNAKIVIIKENPDVTYIVNAIRAGAKEILGYPIIKTEFIDILEKVKQQFSGEFKNQDKCKMITVFSNKGGIGKTSIASNLALELAQTTKENVALIDLNFQFGDITAFMDLQPSFDISYMFDNLNLLNNDFLLSTMEKYKDTSLYVLADSPYFKPAKKISAKQVTRFFETLKKCFSYIVVDTDSTFDEKTITTLDYSDLIFLVTIVNLPALRNCQRCLGLFEKLGYDAKKTQIIINRYMENDEITASDVENLLKKKVYWKIPNNYFALMASINKGILVTENNPTSNVAESYKGLALQVSDSVFRNNLIKKFSPEDSRRVNKILEI